MTGFFRRHWRFIFRSIGVVLVVAGLFFAYWWFYKLAPCRRHFDPQWCSNHSEAQYWQEVQSSIHRGMWSHDDGFTVGYYGDKVWAKWIMDHLKPGNGMNCMSNLCHSSYSMRLITNQDIGDEATPWLDWWKKNESKSQEEWIADGFSLHGLHVDVPPTAEQTGALLAILGNSEGNKSTSIPEHLRYNAFRWLRDSGFEPIDFAVSNHPHSEEISNGLKKYGKFQRRWPSALKIGVLSFGKTPYDPEEYALPRLLESEFQAKAYALIFLPLAVGIVLVLVSLRKATHP